MLNELRIILCWLGNCKYRFFMFFKALVYLITDWYTTIGFHYNKKKQKKLIETIIGF